MITIRTSKPVAYDSPDHIRPYGTALDNSVHAQFNRRLYEIVPADRVRLLDLGCAGGGFVKSILDDGGLAVGLEGSDYSQKRKRAEWATIPDHLFTADVTEPFLIQDEHQTVTFNVITAWEFFEHLRQDSLYDLFDNVHDHVSVKRGEVLFLGSISPMPHVEGGIRLHQTVRPRAWWLERFAAHGWTHRLDLERHFGDDWVRGPNSRQPVPPSFFFAMSRP